MRLLVIYDIGDNGLRVRAAELLQDPAWLAIPAPSVVTMSVLRRLVGFTFGVLSLDGCCDV